MFRANRIGTPRIYQPAASNSTADYTQFERATTEFRAQAMICNASPVLDFGTTVVNSTRTKTHTAGQKMGFAQQFTVTEPQQGDTVGLELVGGMVIHTAASCLIVPFLANLATAATTLFEGKDSTDSPFLLGPGEIQDAADDTVYARAVSYRENVILRNGAAAVAGTYMHGFLIYNNSGASISYTHALLNFGIRQLSDQQNVEYRDTRR